MTKEQSLLLSCLADFCQGRKTQEPQGAEADIDTDELYRIAEEQGVDGIVFNQCRTWLGMNGHFRKGFLGLVFLSANRTDLLKGIAERFRSKGIRLVCMKGAVFRDSYPVPELRSMGDVDFIIRPEDRDKADRIIRGEMGFSRMIDNHDVWTYWTGDIMFEVHTHMFYEYLANRVDYRSYFDRVWDSAHPGSAFGIRSDNLSEPDEELHLLYLIAHTAKHIINNGAGFRAFLDMVLFIRNNEDKLDWSHIREELGKLELLDFAGTCSAFCRRWFGVELPLKETGITDAFFDRVTEKMFRDGVFGLDNAENLVAKPAKLMKRSGSTYGVSAVRYTINLLFPPYRNMQLIPWYSWVDGKPWLLPAAWVYRWFYCLVHKQERGKDLISGPYKQKEEIQDREQLLREWGL